MNIHDDYQHYLPTLIALVKKAGAAILEIYEKSSQFAVQAKKDSSPLTQADLIAHTLIVTGLQAITPTIPVLSEESPDIPFAVRQTWPYYWLVDPLDGTKEFIRHSGDFVINIALIKEQKPIFGLIYSPVLDEIYYAAFGSGAYKLMPDRPLPERIHTRKPSGKVMLVVGHYYKLEKLETVLRQLGEHEIISVGSALKFCMIAAGKADIYPRLGNTSEWDTAAGQIIVEEAGGLVVDFAGQPMRYNSKPSLLNSHFLAVGDKNLLSFFNCNSQRI